MKIFAIRNSIDGDCIELGYFFYYDKIGEYYIELNEGLDEWDCPFVIDHFVRENRLVMDQYYSRVFISQRIIPKDRQNLGQILKANGLDEYDEAKLFILADGRCAQDECFIVPITYERLPESIKNRRRKMLVSASYCEPDSYCVTFSDGSAGIIDISNYSYKEKRISRLAAYEHCLREAQVSVCGAELSFADTVKISYDQLQENLQPYIQDRKTLCNFLTLNLATTQDVMDLLHCTRQNVNDLVKRGRLVPLDMSGKIQIFLRSDVQKLL